MLLVNCQVDKRDGDSSLMQLKEEVGVLVMWYSRMLSIFCDLIFII